VGSDEVILLDTHTAIWFVTANAALGRQSEALAKQALAEDSLAVSAISFWEIALLTAKGRLNSAETPGEQRSRILSGGIVELPLTGDIALISVHLQNLHGDPADRFIAATAIAHDAILMTADKRLLNWRNKSMKRQNASK
jgi:PIN domain nuclease of toxin-antitoxin system